MNNARIEKLERALYDLGMSHSVAGTVFSRVLIEEKLARLHDIKLPRGRKEVLAWCLGIGGLTTAKTFFYGNSMMDALKKAEKFVEQRLQKEKIDQTKDKRFGGRPMTALPKEKAQ